MGPLTSSRASGTTLTTITCSRYGCKVRLSVHTTGHSPKFVLHLLEFADLACVFHYIRKRVNFVISFFCFALLASHYVAHTHDQPSTSQRRTWANIGTASNRISTRSQGMMFLRPYPPPANRVDLTGRSRTPFFFFFNFYKPFSTFVSWLVKTNFQYVELAISHAKL